MRRRQFITLVGGAVAWPLTARAQQPDRVWRISILHSGFPLRTRVGLLIEALRTLGYDDGKTAAIELLGGEGDAARLKSLVAGLAAKKPEVIIALTCPFRKLYPRVVMMQTGQNGRSDNSSVSLDRSP